MQATLDLFESLGESPKEQSRKRAGSQPSGEPELSPCQKAASTVLEGPESVFLTGAAGSGKTYLLQRFLRDRGREGYPVLASTGAAAILVGGRTFHSFFGLGILQGGPQATLERALKNRRVISRLKKTRAVVIDEISMISGTTLSVAESIARKALDGGSPWGGLRVIAVGDFAQLPPVTTSPAASRDWAFLDPVWERSRFEPAVLKTVVRTRDGAYLRILNQVREGSLTAEARDYLDSRCLGAEAAERFEGTRLFPRRETVESHNLRKLETLPAKLHEFPTEYLGDAKRVEDLKKSAPIPEVLRLKEGALVMMRQNDPIGRWVNGSLGQLAAIDAEKRLLRVEFPRGAVFEIEPVSFSLLDAEGEEVASARNFPVNLAYATTIHKSQGMTLERILVDLRHLWEPGQAYVALSRARSGEGLHLAGWTPSSIRADAAVADFYRSLTPSRDCET